MTAWPIKAFGDLTENFDSVRVPVREADRKPGPYPYYGASGVVDHVDGYLFDGEYLLVAEDGENLKTRQTPIAFLATGKFWVNNHAHIVRANAKNNTRYLMYALRCASFGSYLTGSTMPKLTQANMNRVPVVAPPLATQRAIARILGTLDDKIELNHRMNETLEAMARALFKSWFVDFDPVRAKAEGRAPTGMDAETANLFPSELVDSELGPIPRGWRRGTVGDLVTLKRGTTYKGMLVGKPGPALLGLGSIRPGGGFRSEGYKTYGGDCPPDLMLSPGDLYVSLKGATKDGEMIGSVARVPSTVSSGRLTQDTVKLDLRDPGFAPLLYRLLLTPDYRTYCANRATGSAVVALSREDFLGYPVVLPNAAVLARFCAAASALDAHAEQLASESAALGDVRDQLLPRLLSGELSIGDAKSTIEEVA